MTSAHLSPVDEIAQTPLLSYVAARDPGCSLTSSLGLKALPLCRGILTSKAAFLELTSGGKHFGTPCSAEKAVGKVGSDVGSGQSFGFLSVLTLVDRLE